MILQPEFTTGVRRTRRSFFPHFCKPHIDDLRDWLVALIGNFEGQSGGPDVGSLTYRAYVRVMDITGVPDPDTIPVTASQANVDHIQAVRADQRRAADRARKAASKPVSIQAQTLDAVNTLNTKVDSMADRIVQAINSQPAPAQPVVQPTAPLESINWTPIIQALITGVGSAFGLQVNPSTPQPASKLVLLRDGYSHSSTYT